MCNIRSSSAKSSYASTTSSGALTSEGGISSADFSPKSLEKHCRPINVVVMETEVKGSLIERLVHVENRLLQMEEEIVAEKKRVEVEESRSPNHKKKRKGLKQLVKSCVGGQPKMKDSKTDD
ncbi:uncharacterized protein LOC122642943 isoform X2 [Telopea speciosissima]|uniref:uncharacterized protein LOC122642943 isoform X2 n=1 Tax=Telopea speciosissima TaxID=54955 RepID=UPI001CC8212B|nr:uncharacterized protein LOC122642943 isoform X2 [Telopea speciosissima]